MKSADSISYNYIFRGYLHDSDIVWRNHTSVNFDVNLWRNIVACS